jgi:hypothetical protein
MKQWFGIIITALVAALALVAKLFKGKADRLEAENQERDSREREEVARMEERVAAVKERHRDMRPADPKKRDYFE